MLSSKLKSLAAVFALFLIVGVITVGCKQETKSAWVNTNSMPGQTFTQHSQRNSKRSSPTIVYLGSDSHQSRDGFGPKDVNFELNGLK